MSTPKSELLKILKDRGFFYQSSNEEAIDTAFLTAEKGGDPVVGYLGSDPTGDSLHVGHLVPVMIMRWFQKMGNKPIMLVGGATARIGDPSGKDAQRPLLSDEVLEHNLNGLKHSYSHFMNFGEGKTDAVIVDNYDWFKDINYIKFLREVGVHYSINKMLSKDSVKDRLEREQSMSFLEFNYQLFQGYDFVHLAKKYGCSMQLCGSDQWGNAVTGIELGHKMIRKELQVLSCPLLTDANGKKMGKSEGNAVWINENKLPGYDYYQYFRNIDDAVVEKCLKIFTELPLDEIARLSALKDQEINEAKKILAFEATKICRGEEEAKKAEIAAKEVFEKGGISGDLPVVEKDLSGSIGLLDLMVDSGFVASKGEARRLIRGGGVKIADDKVSDENLLVDSSILDSDGKSLISIGKKKKFVLQSK